MPHNTAEKILKIAAKLFAAHGFSGTSVRAIAQEAEVNISAINYHFTDKKTLYRKVFCHSFQDLDSRISKFHESNLELSFEDLSVEVFKILNKQKLELNNTFRMILSSEVDIENDLFMETDPSPFGPPGTTVLLKSLQNELSAFEIPEETLIWAVRMVFSQLAHTSMLIHTKYVRSLAIHKQRKEFYSEEFQTSSVRRHAESIVVYLKQTYPGIPRSARQKLRTKTQP